MKFIRHFFSLLFLVFLVCSLKCQVSEGTVHFQGNGISLKNALERYVSENFMPDSSAALIVYQNYVNDSNFAFIFPVCSSDFFERNIPIAYTYLETSFLKGRYLVCFFDESRRYLSASQSFQRQFYEAFNKQHIDQESYKLLTGEKIKGGCSHEGPTWKLWIVKKTEGVPYHEGEFRIYEKRLNYQFWRQHLRHLFYPQSKKPE